MTADERAAVATALGHVQHLHKLAHARMTLKLGRARSFCDCATTPASGIDLVAHEIESLHATLATLEQIERAYILHLSEAPTEQT
jgi:hypothetical protein